MNKINHDDEPYTFICYTCNKVLPYKYLSQDNENCLTCVEQKENREREYRKESQELAESQNERFSNMKDLMKSLQRGVMGMAFIDIGNSLIHIDNIISITRSESYRNYIDNEESNNKEKRFNIKINTREDNEYIIGDYDEVNLKAKMDEIRKIIREEQKIYLI